MSSVIEAVFFLSWAAACAAVVNIAFRTSWSDADTYLLIGAFIGWVCGRMT